MLNNRIIGNKTIQKGELQHKAILILKCIGSDIAMSAVALKWRQEFKICILMCSKLVIGAGIENMQLNGVLFTFMGPYYVYMYWVLSMCVCPMYLYTVYIFF